MTMTTEDFLDVDQQAPLRVGRDRWLRPYVERADQSGVDPYTRASTLGKALTDEGGLTQWKQRLTATGIAARKDLIIATNAARGDKAEMAKIVEAAMEAAEAGAAATTGTALHALCDQYDAGFTPYVADDFRADVNAYLAMTSSLEVVVSEEFCVNDEFQCAGTPDRIYRLTRDLSLPEKFAPQQERRVVPKGSLVVGDIKTSQTLDHGHISHSAQIALYAGAKRYTVNPDRKHVVRSMGMPVEVPGGDREDWVTGEQVDPDVGIIIHLPSMKGVATVRPVDLQEGRRLCGLAVQVRAERKRKFIGAAVDMRPSWADMIAGATSRDELMAVWHSAVEQQEWSDELTGLAKARIAELERAA